MKIQPHDNELETNVEGKKLEFGIGDASIIIEILRNRLYEHKIQTLVQEYISNARDSHRELGKFDNAFEITVPNRLNPVFKVRDFGPGISPDRMANVFVLYGSSTKRGDNVATGGFGIGAKSAWSYTDSFTIITHLDGIKRTYVAHTGTNSQGRLDLVSKDKTSEPNGTEIQVAVKSHDLDDFRKAIFRAIYFWENKPTLKGELNTPVLTKGTKISDIVETIPSQMLPEYIRFASYSGEVLAVIDGIPYVISGKIVNKVRSLVDTKALLKSELILHIGNGVVQVSASREKIDDSTHSIASLAKIGHEAHRAVKKYISDAFAKVKTTSEYLQTYTEMVNDFEVDEFAKFGDYSIESHSIKSPLFKNVNMTVITTLNRRGRVIQKITKSAVKDTQKDIDIRRFDDLYFIDKDENKLVHGKRIRAFMESGRSTMILLEPKEIIEWNPQAKAADGSLLPATVKSKTLDMKTYNQVIKDLSAKRFHDITYVEAPKAERVKVERENASFCLHTTNRGRFTHTTLASNTQKYFYVPLKDGAWPDELGQGTREDLNDYLEGAEDAKLCGVGERALTMIQGNANFVPLSEYMDDFKPSKEGLLFAKWELGQNSDQMGVLFKLKDLEDPFVVEMVKEYKAFEGKTHKRIPHFILQKLEKLPEIKDFQEKYKKLVKLMKDEYPLVGQYDTYSSSGLTAELAFYMNAKYSANKKGDK